MPTRPPLRTVSRPKQARSAQTLERLLDAAESLIEEKGLADASIPEIVRRAGSSVGGFYGRFRDKDELLRALEERFFGELRERVDALSDPARWEGVATPVIVRACVEELVRTFRERQTLIAMFTARAAQYAEYGREGVRFRSDVSLRFRALIRTRAAEFHHPEPEMAIDMALHVAFGVMHEMIVLGDVWAGGRRITDGELVDELIRILAGYLGLAAPSTGPNES